METSIQLLMYIIAFLIQQAKTNRVGFEGVRVKAMTHKDMILIRHFREINFALKLPFAMLCY